MAHAEHVLVDDSGVCGAKTSPEGTAWALANVGALAALAFVAGSRRARLSESGGSAVAGPGLQVDLMDAVLAWLDGRKSGLEEVAAQAGEHVGG